MGLSSELISQFAKITNDKTETKTTSTVHGETVMYDGKMYVRLDGSDLLTPVATTTNASDGDRVTVVIENHTATVTGNLTSPSATTGEVEKVANQITEFEIVMAYKVTTEDLEATNAVIQNLRTMAANIGKLEAVEADINRLEAKYADLEYVDADTMKALNAEIESIEAKFGEFTDISTEDLEAIQAEINVLKGYTADFTYVSADVLEAIKASIKELEVKKLSAEQADIRYANIDFSNIGEAAIEKIFADSGLIKDLVVGDGTITGNLVGVTIKGDLIEGGTVVADKLVVKGEDGLYYKLNTDGVTTEAEQTDYNSLNGSIITAKSITATKISVEDLVAFGATIGGFNITENSIYSGVKSSVDNTTRGIYLDNDGQVAFGDESNYLKFYKESDGVYKLAISASSIVMSSSGKSVETIVEEVEEKIDNLEIGGRNLLIRRDLVSGYIEPGTGIVIKDPVKGALTTDWIDVSDCNYITITLYDNIPYTSPMVDSYGYEGIYACYAFYSSNDEGQLVEMEIFEPTTPGHIVCTKLAEGSHFRATLLGCDEYRYKIEKGNKSTDYTLAPEDLDEQINNIEIGGRNYVRYGKGTVNQGFFANFDNVENGYGEHTLTSQNDYPSINQNGGYVLGCRDYEVGASMIWSYDIMYTQWDVPDNSLIGELWFGQRYSCPEDETYIDGCWTPVTNSNMPYVDNDQYKLNEWYHIEQKVTIPAQVDESIGTQEQLLFYYQDVDNPATITVCIKNVKLEYGHKATDWTAAPEDTEDSISDVRTEITEQSATILNECDKIVLKATESLVSTSEYEEFKSTTEAQLSVLPGQIDMKFAESSAKTESVNEDLQTKWNELQKYITFSTDGIKVSAGEGQMSIRIDNDIVIFEQGDKQFGWWDGENFHTGNIMIDVTERAQFGNFAFIPRENGSLSFKKVNNNTGFYAALRGTTVLIYGSYPTLEENVLNVNDITGTLDGTTLVLGGD